MKLRSGVVCSGLGATYPPKVSPQLEAAATGIAAIMADLAADTAPRTARPQVGIC